MRTTHLLGKILPFCITFVKCSLTGLSRVQQRGCEFCIGFSTSKSYLGRVDETTTKKEERENTECQNASPVSLPFQEQSSEFLMKYKYNSIIFLSAIKNSRMSFLFKLSIEEKELLYKEILLEIFL